MCPLSCIWTSSKSDNEKFGECLSSLGWTRIQVRTGSFISKKSDYPFLHLTLQLTHDKYYTVALWTFSQRPPVPFVHRTNGSGHHCELTSTFLWRRLFFCWMWRLENSGMQQTVCGVCGSKTRGKKNSFRWFIFSIHFFSFFLQKVLGCSLTCLQLS